MICKTTYSNVICHANSTDLRIIQSLFSNSTESFKEKNEGDEATFAVYEVRMHASNSVAYWMSCDLSKFM